MAWLDGITTSVNMNLGKLREMMRDWEAWLPRGHRVRHNLMTETVTIPSSRNFPGNIGRISERFQMKYGTFGEGSGTPLQYSCLENPMDGGAWWASVRGVAKSRTQLSNFTLTFHFHALEKEMATHSSVLAWRIPETGEPGGLPSMGLHRVGHD